MIKDFRDKAERAERLARAINDARTCEALLKHAGECREKLEAQCGLRSKPLSVFPRTGPQPATSASEARPTAGAFRCEICSTS